MAKRRTIGENPLDAVMAEHPLDAVVPDPSAARKAGRAQPLPEKDLAEAEARLTQLESGMSTLKAEMSRLRAELRELKSAVTLPSDLPWWMSRIKKTIVGK
jgi:hypothetical protein